MENTVRNPAIQSGPDIAALSSEHRNQPGEADTYTTKLVHNDFFESSMGKGYFPN